MKKIVSVLLALLACIAFSGIAHAASTTTSLYVGVNVVPACQVSVWSVDFGIVFANATYTANGDVQVNCSLNTPYNIALDSGGSFDATWRRVNWFGNTIQYGLYKEPAYILQWGDSGYANTYLFGSSVADIANGLWQSHVVYGQMTVPVGAPASSYSDSVLVTVYF